MNRKPFIDVLRGIGIILVILGHCHRPELSLKLIQSFHMPLFFIISGYLFNREQILTGSSKKYIKKKARALLLPYLFFSVFHYLLTLSQLIINDLPKAEFHEKAIRYFIGLIYSRGTWYWMPNCSPIWFLTAMFVALFIFHLLMKASFKKQILFISLCTIFACLCSYTTLPKLPWNIDSACMSIIFLWFGYYCKQSKLLESKYTLIFIIPLLTLGAITAYFNPIDFVSIDSVIMGDVALMYISALSTSTALLIIIYRFIKHNRFLEFMGRNTIIIIGFNYTINSIVYYLFEQTTQYLNLQLDHQWFYEFILQTIILAFISLAYEKIKLKRKNYYISKKMV